jgi:alkylated DNA repair dioxygenase AlkB
MDLQLPNSNIKYYNKILTGQQSYNLYQYLVQLSYWEKKDIIVAGRKCKQNRYTCFFSLNPEYNYFYSGINNTGKPFTKELLDIKNLIEEILNNKYKFNYCLLNYYEDGTQNIGMHADDETDLEFPVIASLSIGAERFFDFHHKTQKDIKKRINLENGSLVVMDGTTQKYYKHGVPVQKKIKNGRINLTFRVVKTPKKSFSIIKSMAIPKSKLIKGLHYK